MQYLCIQQKMQDKELVVEKGNTNADLMTKSLSAEVATNFTEKLGTCRAEILSKV